MNTLHPRLRTISSAQVFLLCCLQEKYLVGLEADREKYRKDVIKKKSESPGWLWGKNHKDLDDKALAIIEEEVKIRVHF